MRYILLISTLLTLSCNNQPGVPKKKDNFSSTELSSYHDQKEGFTIFYPKGWDTTTTNAQVIFMAAADTAGKMPAFRSNLNVIKTPYDGSYSIAELMKVADAEFMKEYSDREVLSRTDSTNAAGLRYGSLKSVIRVRGYSISSVSTYFPGHKQLYIISFANGGADSLKYDRLYEQIVDHFKLD